MAVSATSDLKGQISWALKTQMKSLYHTSLRMLDKLYSLHNSILIAITFKKTVWLRNRDGELKIQEETAHPYPQVRICHPTESHSEVHACLHEFYFDHQQPDL